VNSKIRIYEPNTSHLLWFEEVMMFSKQAQQNYYAFDQLERHYGLGGQSSVDVTITFYPSGTVVRKNGVAADSTIVIGEDGSNGTVQPPSPTMSLDASSADVSAPPPDSGSSNQDGSGAAPNGNSGSGSNANPATGAPASGGSPPGEAGAAPRSKSSGCGCTLLGSDRTVGLYAALGALVVGALRRRGPRRADRGVS